MLFDLDGTIIDPRPGFFESITHALAVVGIEVPTEAALAGLIGPPLEDGLAGIGVPDERIGDAVDAYRDRYGSGALLRAPVYPGMVEVLTELAGTGRIVGLATSKPWVYAERILDGLGLRDRFTVVGGAELDGRRRAKAEVVAAVLDRLGGPPVDEVVLVGDRHFDLDGARAHGIGMIGVTWGFAVDGELDGADVVVGDAGGLSRALDLPTSGCRLSPS